MKVIQAEYNGRKYRSTLEARWAMFFDSDRIKTAYEPDGFEMEDGTRYLPDFFLPEMRFRDWKGVYFEVKPTQEKADEDQERHTKFATEGNLVLIVGFLPPPGHDDRADASCYAYLPNGTRLTHVHLMQCTACDYPEFFHDTTKEHWCRCCGKRAYWDNLVMHLRAKQAMTHRFWDPANSAKRGDYDPWETLAGQSCPAPPEPKWPR